MSEQEQVNIDRAIALETLSLKRQERNNKAIKFLNVLIKLLTFGNIDKNKEMEIKISNKQTKTLKTCNRKAETNPSLFSKSCGQAFNKQQANNEATNLPSTNLNKTKTPQM